MECNLLYDNNIKLYLSDSDILKHSYKNTTYKNLSKMFIKYTVKKEKEKYFRMINTYLINNNIIPISKNIIDLGAYIGDNTLAWAKNIKGNVYAIDPCNDNLKYIKKNAEINNIKNITCLEYAISDKNKIISTDNDLIHVTFVYDNTGINGKYKFNAVSLDYLYEKNYISEIGYIHLDVEGMEFDVLKGSSKIIDIFNPIITFEQHLSVDDTIGVLNYLQKKKYKTYIINERCGEQRDCKNFISFPENINSKKLIFILEKI